MPKLSPESSRKEASDHEQDSEEEAQQNESAANNSTEEKDEDNDKNEDAGTEEEEADPKERTPVQQQSLNEADVTGSIISVRTSQAPNSALQVFKTKKRFVQYL